MADLVVGSSLPLALPIAFVLSFIMLLAIYSYLITLLDKHSFIFLLFKYQINYTDGYDSKPHKIK